MEGTNRSDLKSAVYRASKYEPELNEAFERFALHYGTAIVPTRPYKPKDKALVEGAVKIVYKRIYALLRDKVFFTLDELNAAIKEFLVAYNNKISKSASESRANLLHLVEIKELKPLPATRYEMYSYGWATVYKNSYIMLSEDRHYYSVPWELIGKKVKVVYNAATVEIYYHLKLVAVHQRSYNPRSRTTIKEHLPANLQFINELNTNMLINRAMQIGTHTQQVITNIIDDKPHPDQARKSCMGILHMGKKVGKLRLEKACERALYYGNYGYGVIKMILQKELDKEPLPVEEEIEAYKIGPHENIRGSNYYQ